MTITENGTVTVSRYVKTSTIQEMYELGRGTLFRITKDPSFPKPIVLPGGHYRYPADEIAAWFENLRDRPSPRTAPKRATIVEDRPVIYATRRVQ
jgi:predicted DNA-binding transcriptional regulator AlpA